MKLGDLHNRIMELDITCDAYKHNPEFWQRGFNTGAKVAKDEASLLAIRYEAYTKALERMILSQQKELSAFSENYLTQDQLEAKLAEIQKEHSL